MRVIEKATAKDKDEILKLYKSQLGRKYCPWNDDYPSMETIDFDLSRDALLVMREEGKIIAAISVDDDEEVNNLECWTSELQPGGELSRLAVSPDCQSKGLAKEMIETGLEELRDRSYKSLHFLVNRHNLKALKCYSAFPFNKVGECEIYEQPMLCYEMEL